MQCIPPAEKKVEITSFDQRKLIGKVTEMERITFIADDEDDGQCWWCRLESLLGRIESSISARMFRMLPTR